MDRDGRLTLALPDAAVRGIPWTIASYLANKVLTIATTVFLARLLSPEDFGLWTLAFFVLMALSPLRDFGLGTVLIVRPQLDRATKGTCLTLMLGLAAAAAAAVAALSPAVAKVFNEPRLGGVLAAVTVTLVTVALAWFYEALMQRDLDFRKRFWGQLAHNVVYFPIAVVLALLGAGIWSIVIGYIVGNAFGAGVYMALAPERVRPSFDRKVARSLLADGWGFVGQATIAFLRQNADYLAVSRVLGTRALGFYSMAYRIAELPYVGVAEPVSRVTVSAFARMRAAGEDVAPVFLQTLRAIAFVTFPFGVLVSATAPAFADAVLGEKWLPMAGALAVLGLMSALRSAEWTLAAFLNACGHSRTVATLSAAVLVPLLPAFFVAAHHGDIETVAWVTVADMVVMLPALAVVIRRRLGIAVGRLIGSVWSVVVGTVLAWGAAKLLSRAADGWVSGAALVGPVLGGAAVYLVATRLLAPDLLGDVFRQLGRAFGRSVASGGAQPAAMENFRADGPLA